MSCCNRLIQIFGCAILSCVSAGYGGYTIVSINHHTSGQIDNEEVYNTWQTEPITSTYSDSTGSLSGYTKKDLSAGFDVYSCSAFASIYDSVVADSRAEIIATFRPIGNTAEIHMGNTGVLEPPYEGYWKVEITDLTTNSILWLQDPDGGSADGTFLVNPDHLYKLYVYAGTTTQDFNGATVDVLFTVIPEPASLLFMSLGYLSIRFRAKH